MAIYVNGKKVAGIGAPGKSPYQAAVAGGYTGGEAEFNQKLANMGAIPPTVTVTFTADQWTGTEDLYTLTIPQTQHKRASADFIFQVFGMAGDGKYAKNTWEALERIWSIRRRPGNSS